MAILIMLVAGIAAVVAAFAYPGLDYLPRLLLGGVGLVVMLFSAVAVIVTKLYQRASASHAFVRTGAGGARVILDGGSLVIPVLHKTVPVSLETMRLNVERRGGHALITKDNLRVDLSAEFYIKVQPSQEDILQAARSLGSRSVDPGAVSELVQEKLVSALRTVAATKELVELHSKRDEFAAAVQQIVQHELGANGLSLETVTISSLDQTDAKSLQEANVFDAQGLRKIAQITQQARIERNQIEREAEQAVVGKNVETRKKVLGMEWDQAEYEAEQKMKVANIHAARHREVEEFRLAQDEAVARRGIEKNQAVETAEVERALAVEQAELTKRITLVVRQREQETTEIEKVKAVEVAQREREVAVAMKEAERASAQAKMLTSDAERESAKQRVLTVQVTSEAQRQAEKELIAAKQKIEQDKIREQTAADVLAYARVKEAEGERQAADLTYEAKLRLAEGDLQAATRRAEGERAQQMVEVNVDRERVDVERVRVEVERQSLSNKQEFEGAALRFELEKLRIEADKEVRVQTAASMSKIMHGADVRIFGDPSTMSSMMHGFVKAANLGMSADGLLQNLSPDARNVLTGLGMQIGEHFGAAPPKAPQNGGPQPTAEATPVVPPLDVTIPARGDAPPRKPKEPARH